MYKGRKDTNFMFSSDCVSLEEAIILKKLGYNGSTNKIYRDNILVHIPIHGFGDMNMKENEFLCPYYFQVMMWAKLQNLEMVIYENHQNEYYTEYCTLIKSTESPIIIWESKIKYKNHTTPRKELMEATFNIISWISNNKWNRIR